MLAKQVDIAIETEEGFTAVLGFTIPETDHGTSNIDPVSFRAMINQVTESFPNFGVVAARLRATTTAGLNDRDAVSYARGEFHHSRLREMPAILDRVGGGGGEARGGLHAMCAKDARVVG